MRFERKREDRNLFFGFGYNVTKGLFFLVRKYTQQTLEVHEREREREKRKNVLISIQFYNMKYISCKN